MPESYEVQVTVRSKDHEVTVHGEMTSEAPTVEAAAAAAQDALKHRLADYRPIDGDK